MTPRIFIVILVSIVLVIARFAGVKNEPFQATAHLWVGGLIATWWWFRFAPRGSIAGWLTIGMSIAELVAFLVTRGSAV